MGFIQELLEKIEILTFKAPIMLYQVEISKYSFGYLMYVKFEIDEKLSTFI